MESQHIEYKSKLIPEIEKSVVAFLNSREGGVLYIGLDKHGRVVGLRNPDQDQVLLSSRLRNILSLPVWVYLICF